MSACRLRTVGTRARRNAVTGEACALGPAGCASPRGACGAHPRDLILPFCDDDNGGSDRPQSAVAVSVVIPGELQISVRNPGSDTTSASARPAGRFRSPIRGSRSAPRARVPVRLVRSRAHPLPHERAKRGQNRGSCVATFDGTRRDVGRRHVATQSRVHVDLTCDNSSIE